MLGGESWREEDFRQIYFEEATLLSVSCPGSILSSNIAERPDSLRSRDFPALRKDRPHVRVNFHYRFGYAGFESRQFRVEFENSDVPDYVERSRQLGQQVGPHASCESLFEGSGVPRSGLEIFGSRTQIRYDLSQLVNLKLGWVADQW